MPIYNRLKERSAYLAKGLGELIPIANQYRKLSVLIFAMVYADTYLKCL
jgi:hypothetical protein